MFSQSKRSLIYSISSRRCIKQKNLTEKDKRSKFVIPYVKCIPRLLSLLFLQDQLL